MEQHENDIDEELDSNDNIKNVLDLVEELANTPAEYDHDDSGNSSAVHEEMIAQSQPKRKRTRKTKSLNLSNKIIDLPSHPSNLHLKAKRYTRK
ncbi:hypothetical protein N0O92_10220 [Alkalihalobacillus sp. MEB130]|uniref:hypothetical protein n=1 Tax=Alkalihalobacillus sp. MEB130 TaxID=2976704 RepID=UPI0028DFBE84|nr:hypothetical protein [Alkalihalobacillus sp. MEB130]MDT8860609.1 hypothetical protein [Alkalihalobacillus sp. MEB130]